MAATVILLRHIPIRIVSESNRPARIVDLVQLAELLISVRIVVHNVSAAPAMHKPVMRAVAEIVVLPVRPAIQN